MSEIEAKVVSQAKRITSEFFLMPSAQVVGLPCSDCRYLSVSGQKRVNGAVVPIQSCKKRADATPQRVQYEGDCGEFRSKSQASYFPSDPEAWMP
ncbi:MAG TPA: hypothetical protein VF185_02965 [Patescibacteria group bacterium]